MPATRSRTEHWEDCLRKIAERGGAIEISLGRSDDEPSAPAADVVWRVRVIEVRPDAIVVETPGVFGQSIEFRPGVALVGAITVGQNRWMFHTTTLAGPRPADGRPGAGPGRLVLSSPQGVERCTRRNFHRISTANLQLPVVECWPLMDPTTVVGAEAANRARIHELIDVRAGRRAGAELSPDLETDPMLLPSVGPKFLARMMNLSGGGLGLKVDRAESSAVHLRPHLWCRVDLTPDIPAPVAVTARVAHTNIDLEQNVAVGLSFDFTFNPEHRDFVISLLADYVDRLQRRQLARAS